MDLGNGLSCIVHGNGLLELRMLGGYSVVITSSEALTIAAGLRLSAGEANLSFENVVIATTQAYIDSVVRSNSVLDVTRLIRHLCVPKNRFSLLEARHLGDLVLAGKLRLVAHEEPTKP